MRPSTAVLSAVTLIVGVGGGAVAYELASSVGEQRGATDAAGTTEITSVVDETPATIVPGTRFRWAPCEAPAVLRGDTCVTTEVRTVFLPSAPADHDDDREDHDEDRDEDREDDDRDDYEDGDRDEDHDEDDEDHDDDRDEDRDEDHEDDDDHDDREDD